MSVKAWICTVLIVLLSQNADQKDTLCHAFLHTKTRTTSVMFSEGRIATVENVVYNASFYDCYRSSPSLSTRASRRSPI